MMSLDERLNKAEEMIQKPSFRENKGLVMKSDTISLIIRLKRNYISVRG